MLWASKVDALRPIDKRFQMEKLTIVCKSALFMNLALSVDFGRPLGPVLGGFDNSGAEMLCLSENAHAKHNATKMHAKQM